MSERIAYENLARSNQAQMAELEEAAKRVLRGGWYVLGSEVAAFESEFAAYLGVEHCVGVANGLDALVLSLAALDLQAGDEVLVASNTYIATILAIVRAGLTPVLVEPDPETFNIDPKLLGRSLTGRTRAICVTHLFGKPCRMDLICSFAGEHGLRVVEDCAQSHGSLLGGRQTGTFGDLGCFSFYPTKNLGAFGDAGAVVTRDASMAEKLRHLRNYGSHQKYVNVYLGYNSRLDEIQAALLRVKLKFLTDVIEHKRALADLYFAGLPNWLIKPVLRSDEFDSFHIYAVRHAARDQLRRHMLDQGVATEVHYPIPPHRQEAMKGILAGSYPIADTLHQTEISLPISAGHTKSDILRVIEVVSRFEGA
jgi:dTDP-4-amino-4,6-dideoxygalactose transaminase